MTCADKLGPLIFEPAGRVGGSHVRELLFIIIKATFFVFAPPTEDR